MLAWNSLCSLGWSCTHSNSASTTWICTIDINHHTQLTFIALNIWTTLKLKLYIIKSYEYGFLKPIYIWNITNSTCNPNIMRCFAFHTKTWKSDVNLTLTAHFTWEESHLKDCGGYFPRQDASSLCQCRKCEACFISTLRGP